ncbi:MAG: MFS transporter [Dehalococcoidia bacterium]|nr:MFS transporter [Dehalococcoidia bacterium]
MTNRQGVVNLVAGQAISVSGDLLLLTAASIVVFDRTDSATAVSLLLAIAALPTVVLGPLAGTLADWFPRRRILVVTDLSSAVACGVALLLSRALSVEAAAFVSIAVVSALSAFYRPAAQALLPVLVSEEGLGRANSAIRLASSLAAIAGPAAAAFLTSRGGLELVLLVDAASFVVSAGLALLIQNVPPAAVSTRRNAFRDAWAGLDYARKSRNIRLITTAVGVVLLAGTVVNAGTLPLVVRTLDLPDNRYGALLAIEGAGALALAAFMLTVGPGKRLLVTGSFALLGTGATTILLGGAPTFGVAAAALLLQGASVVAFQVAFASYLQHEAEDAYRGRVMSLVGMVASLAQLAGFAVAGPLIDAIGTRAAFLCAGIAVCAVAVPVVSLAFVSARTAREATAA